MLIVPALGTGMPGLFPVPSLWFPRGSGWSPVQISQALPPHLELKSAGRVWAEAEVVAGVWGVQVPEQSL